MEDEKRIFLRKSASQERSRFTVEQILIAAAQVFNERGYAGTTTNHIAERAGVSIGSVYQYFPNKDAILAMLIGQHMDSAEETIQRFLEKTDLFAADLTDLLTKVVQAAVDLHTQSPRLHFVLLSEALWSSEAVARVHEMEDYFSDMIGQMLVDHPMVRVRNPRCAAYLLVHITKDLAHEYVIHPPKEISKDELIGEIVQLLKAYLSAER